MHDSYLGTEDTGQKRSLWCRFSEPVSPDFHPGCVSLGQNGARQAPESGLGLGLQRSERSGAASKTKSSLHIQSSDPRFTQPFPPDFKVREFKLAFLCPYHVSTSMF